MIINILSFFIVLGILIFSHELGHFIAAKLCGVGVEKFSLGFGPRLVGFKKGITDYRISMIPLGGYVKMVGDDFESSIDKDLINLSFSHKKIYKKIIIVLAGPFFNIFLAFLMFFLIFSISGIFILEPIIGETFKDMPASNIGLISGDKIISINEDDIGDWDGLISSISSSNGDAIKICYRRDDIFFNIEIVPTFQDITNSFGQKTSKYLLGVTPIGKTTYLKLDFIDSIFESIKKTYDVICITFSGIINLIRGIVSTKIMGGPIMIAEMAGQHAKAGVLNLMFFIAVLSINLAILNCLPIPILDGGHFLFFIIEIFIGKPLNIKFKEIAHQIGGLFLFLLMIYVFYNDIMRVFLR